MIYYVSVEETKGKDMEPKVVGNNVKTLMEQNKITIKELADKMGITSKTLSRKLKGEQEFCVSEIMMITKIFDLSINACTQIFFSTNEEDSYQASS